MDCLHCKKEINQPTGKAKKRFCNNTCRSNYWYGKNKKGKPKDELNSKIQFKKTTKKSFDAPKKERFIADEAGQWQEPNFKNDIERMIWEEEQNILNKKSK